MLDDRVDHPGLDRGTALVGDRDVDVALPIVGHILTGEPALILPLVLVPLIHKGLALVLCRGDLLEKVVGNGCLLVGGELEVDDFPVEVDVLDGLCVGGLLLCGVRWRHHGERVLLLRHRRRHSRGLHRRGKRILHESLLREE